MMEDTSVEITSFDFTSEVMSEVLALEKKRSISYKPVISKRGWFFIFAGICGLIVWLIFNGYLQDGPSTNFDFTFIKSDYILKVFQFSNITTNILLFAMAMIFIQIIFLKSYLNKRFDK
jgi:uncharacterized integral membrane protein